MEKIRLAGQEARLFQLWTTYNENYRTLRERYEALLKKKRELKIQPLDRVPAAVFKEWPEIDFLEIDSDIDVIRHIKTMTEKEIRQTISKIETLPFDFNYTTLRDRVIQFEYEIEHFGRRKSQFGYDTNYGGGRLGAGNSKYF